MRRFFLILLGAFWLASPGLSLERKLLELHLSPEGVYLIEELRFFAKEDPRIPFPGLPKNKVPETVFSPPGCMITWLFKGEADPEGDLARGRKSLLKRKKDLERELEILKFEEDWWRSLRPSEPGRDAGTLLARISESLHRIGERRTALEEELSEIEANLAEIGEKLAIKKFLILNLILNVWMNFLAI